MVHLEVAPEEVEVPVEVVLLYFNIAPISLVQYLIILEHLEHLEVEVENVDIPHQLRQELLLHFLGILPDLVEAGLLQLTVNLETQGNHHPLPDLVEQVEQVEVFQVRLLPQILQHPIH